jgi:hypothetical protein
VTALPIRYWVVQLDDARFVAGKEGPTVTDVRQARLFRNGGAAGKVAKDIRFWGRKDAWHVPVLVTVEFDDEDR